MDHKILIPFVFCMIINGVQCKEECSRVEKADMVFVVDSSGSIKMSSPDNDKEMNWRLSLEFLTQIVDKVRTEKDGWHIGMVVFGNNAQNQFYLKDFNDRNTLIQEIMKTPYLDENTNTSAALRLARLEQFRRENGDRADVPNVIIVLTDGASTYNQNETVPEAELCHQAGITVFSVGVSQEINKTELRLISSPPRQQDVTWFTTPSFSTLNSIVEKITDETCRRVENVTMTCPDFVVNEDELDYWKLWAIIATIVAGILLLAVLSCGIIALTFSNRLSSLKKNKSFGN